MTKAEQARVTAWRLKILRYSQGEPRQVARTCRHFGISRTAFYRWKRRFDAHGEAGLADRPRTPLRSPRTSHTTNAGNATRSRSRDTACRWT
jgi:transposase-like protein